MVLLRCCRKVCVILLDASTLHSLLIVCPLVFLAGFVDSVAGGGGLISLPAYLAAGLPIHVAYGTNKLSSCCGTVVATAKYAKSGYISWKPSLVAGGAALVGSYLGAKLVLILSEKVLHWTLLCVLPVVAVFLIFNRGFGKEENNRTLPTGVLLALAAVIGLVIGAYDGFFGPGTGTFLVIAFTAVLGWNLTTATGGAKVVNLCSNLAALVAYAQGGSILLAVGIPAAVCNIAGNYLGSWLAVKKGAPFIRPVILVSVGLLFLNILKDVL